jgi:hypothetical protein
MILEANLKKSTLALSALTLALAAGLSACGAGTSSHTVAGVVTGLQFGPLVLTTNGQELTLQPAPKDASGNVPNVNFAFPNQLDYGDPYNVNLKQIGTDANNNPIYQQPPHQICGQNGGTTDTAGRVATINAVISCQLVSNTIGGTISGLTADNLILVNGSSGGQLPVTKGSTTFTFAQQVTYGQTYGVTVLQQPTGQTCTVANGAGEMGDVAISSISVTCRDNT